MPKVLKTSETPNPQALRFHLDRPIIASGSRDFPTVEAAQGHPLAARLFEIPPVTAVFFLAASVTVSKDEETGWETLITPIADVLEEFALPPAEPDSIPMTVPAAASQETHYASLNPEEKRARIQALLDSRVRPGLQGDGGDLDLVDCDGHNVVVRYAGACGTCPSSITGTLAFIQDILREQVDPGLTVHLA